MQISITNQEVIMNNDFESVAQDLSSVTEEGQSKISKLVQIQMKLEDRVAECKAELKRATDELKAIQEDQLPAAMAEYHMKDQGFDDGSAIKLTKFYSITIPKDKADQAFDWLVNNTHGDLIKNTVSANFVRGKEQEAKEFTEELENRGMSVNTRKWVESQTLKGWYREQIEKGNSVPDEFFNGFIGEKVIITRK